MTETEKYLIQFTRREDALLKWVRKADLDLPSNLTDWPLWIGDPERYLHELRNFVDKYAIQ